MDESDSDSDSDSDNDSNGDSDSEDDQSLTEEEATAAAIEKRDEQLSSLLERKNELPLRTKNRFNELVAELLTKTKDDVHEMICDNNIDADDYRGLDSSRDTEAQVETALRFFPEVISQPCNEEDEEGVVEYPIQRLCLSNEGMCNVKAVSFIAVVAPLAIEFHSFEDYERGGLLIEDYIDDISNTFEKLIYNLSLRPDQHDLILTLLIRLRRMGLFKKDDIKDYRLVPLLCCADALSERVFQFLVEWDPTALLQTNVEWGCLPLHWAAQSSIRGFTIVVRYGICYYPFKKGIRLLFQKDDDGETPFQHACQKYGRERVMEVVEEVLAHYSQETPLHSVEALMVTAADEDVHLDCSFFLLRRKPDVLVRLLSGPHNNNNNDDGGGGDDDDDTDDKDGNENDGDNDDDENDNDEDDDNEGDGGGDDDNVDDENDRAGTRKRKRRV